MAYINPYNLLGILADNIFEVDNVSINKAKRKLFAEIELSDTNTIFYDGIEINKGDCLQVIDELDNRDKRDFHFFIYQNKNLKEFLTTGKLYFFESYQTESIYKLPEFLDFISPFFAEQYDRILLENYKQWNHKDVTKILSIKPITNAAYSEKCYKSTYAHVKDIDNEINDIIKSIANSNSPYINKEFLGLDNELIEKVNVPLLNLLPNYFQVLRNLLALSIRNLARDINNDPHNLYEPAFKIIDIANNISTDALTHQTITKGYYTIKKNYEDDLAKLKAQKQETVDSQLRSWWRKKVNQIDSINQEIEDGQSKYIDSDFYALDTVVYEIADPAKLNALSGNFQNVRNEIADTVCSLAFTVNNEPHHNHKIAYDLISIAYRVNADGDIAERISNAYTIIKGNFENQVEQYSSSKHSGSKQPETKETKEESKKEKANWAYKITLTVFCGIMVWALFNPTVRIVMLSLSLLSYGIQLYNRDKKPENFKNEKTADLLHFVLSLIVCVCGYFYLPFALLFISYNLIAYLHQVAVDIFLNEKLKKERKIGYLIIALLITFSLFNYEKANEQNSNDKLSEASPQQSDISSNISETPDSLAVQTDANARPDTTVNTLPPPPEPAYTLPNIDNGNIVGCSNIHPKHNKKVDNKLVISCGSNADVAVKMINSETNKSIRYVYIHKNTTYTIRNIPEGKYYLKIAYGDNWSVKEGESICQGRFTTNTVYKKGEEILDYNLIYHNNGRYQVPSYSLRLNVVFTTNDNTNTFSTDHINENDFYNE